MYLKRYISLAIGMLVHAQLCAQSESDWVMERLTDLMVEDLAEGIDLSELAERLDFYRAHPIDLNRTDGSELQELSFVPQLFIDNLLEHRQRSGKFIAIQELQTVAGLDMELLRLLAPYVTVLDAPGLPGVGARELWGSGAHDVMFRYGRVLQKRHGYTITDTTRSRYLGTPDQLFVRYRYRFGNDLQVSLNMKKDPGEAFLTGAQRYGFDFYTGSLYIANQGKLKKVVIGDYALQFGQGLAMWNGMGFGKGSVVQGIAKQAIGLRPYTSSNEALFLRGAAATVAWNGLSATPFFSWRRLDGSVSRVGEGIAIARSISQTGLHRTPTEVANRHALSQWVYGANVQYEHPRLRAGATAYYTQLDVAIMPPDVLRNRYVFRGYNLWNASAYYNYSWKGIYLFGEAAHSLESGSAFVNGLIATVHSHLSLALHHRHYAGDYHTFFGQGLAEGSDATNERGYYVGLVYHPSRKVEWASYADVFRFPWARYRVDAPSRGVDVLTQFTYTWYKRAEVSVRYRYRQREENASAVLSPGRLAQVLRQQMRLHGQYKITDAWSIRSRMELSHYQKEGEVTEWGWMGYQDLIYNPMNGTLSGNTRVALFGTPGYNSRIYAYENDVLYAYSFPVYHNRGIRVYANLRCRIGRKADVWFRYAMFVYRGVDEVGSGLDRIEGNRRSDVRLQFRWQF